MSLKPQRSIRNALLNRVRRHATIATIFRASDPVQPMSPMSQGHGKFPESLVSDGAELVQATLVNLPTLSINPRPSSAVPLKPRKTNTEQISVQKKSKPTPLFDTTTDQSYDTNPEETHSTRDSEIEDTTWRKLKNIFRKHQEQDSQKRHIKKTEGHTTIPVQMKSEVSDISGEPRNNVTFNTTVDQDVSSDPEVLYPDTGTEPLNQPESSDDHLEERKYRKSHTIKPDPEIPAIGSHDQPDVEIADRPLSRNLENYAEDHHKGVEEPEDPISSESLGHKDLGSKPELNSDPKLHEIPLEAAWPVQKKKVQPIQKSDESSWDDQTSQKSEHKDIQSDIQTAVGVNTIQRALKNVGPGQPTSSSIEIITPRRPRPRLQEQGRKTLYSKKPDVQKTVSKPVNESAHQFPDAPSPKPGRPVADELSGRDQDLKEIPEKTELGTLPLNIPSKGDPYQPQVDRVQDAGDYSSEDQIDMDELGSDPETELVQTDIGQLPVDLWHILNQDAPPTTKGEEIQTESEPTNINRGSQVMRKMESPSSRTGSPGSKNVVEPKISQNEGSNLQRSVSTNDNRDVPSSTTSTESANETNSDDENSQSTEPDINELSVQVYAEIKRRLMVEWERKRNRNL